MKKIHYGWVVCICLTFMTTISVGLAASGFSVIVPYIIKELGFSNTDISVIVTSRSILSTLLLFGYNKISKKIGVKNTAIFGLVTVVASYVGMIFIPSYWLFMFCASFAGFNQALCGMACVGILINNWFISKRRLALSICAMGSGISSMIFSPIVGTMCEKFGHNGGFMTIAVISALCLAATILFIKETPQEMGLEPYSDGKEVASQTKLFGSGISGLRYAFLLATICLLGITLSSVQFSAAAYSFAGFDAAKVSLLISIYGIGMIVGKLIFGYFTDRGGSKQFTMVYTLFFVIGMVIHSIANPNMFILGVGGFVFAGFGATVTSMGITTMTYDFASEDQFAVAHKNMQTAVQAGLLVGGVILGMVSDFFGNYHYTMLVCASTAIIALGLQAYLYGTIKKA